MSVLISVVIPVYKTEAYIVRCIESVRQQSYNCLEIILVDDGSPDQCPKICDEYSLIDKRIKVIHQDNRGLSEARNAGVGIATGEYVIFLDSDDWIGQVHLEMLLSAAIKSKADVVIGSHTKVWANGSQKICKIGMNQGLREGKSIISEIIFPLLGADAHFPKDVQLEASVAMNLYRMDLIRQNNLRFLDERVIGSEDLFFNFDYFMHAERIYVSDENEYYYYQNNNSLTHRYDPCRSQRAVSFYHEINKRVSKYRFGKEVNLRIQRTFIMKIRVAIKCVVMSDLARCEKLKFIKELLDNSTVKSVLSEYPIEMYPAVMRLLILLMKQKNSTCVYYIIAAREMIRNISILSSIVKQ